MKTLTLIQALNESTPWYIKLLAPVLLSAGLTWGAAHVKSDQDVANRVTTLEQQRKDDRDYVKTRFDQTDDKVNRLLDWALGTHEKKGVSQ